MITNQFGDSKKNYKLVEKMPQKRCIICQKKPFGVGIHYPYGPSEFAEPNRHLKIAYFLCYECALDPVRSSQKIDEIMTLAYGKCEANA